MDMFPFSIHLAMVKLELTSHTDSKSGVTYRPSLVCDTTAPHKSVLTLKSSNGLNRQCSFGLVSVTPLMFGKAENKSGVDTYTPIMIIGWYDSRLTPWTAHTVHASQLHSVCT
jgi:hypothetical protein